MILCKYSQGRIFCCLFEIPSMQDAAGQYSWRVAYFYSSIIIFQTRGIFCTCRVLTLFMKITVVRAKAWGRGVLKKPWKPLLLLLWIILVVVYAGCCLLLFVLLFVVVYGSLWLCVVVCCVRCFVVCAAVVMYAGVFSWLLLFFSNYYLTILFIYVGV